MALPICQVRRATLDDRGALKALWEAMRLPADDLDKRLTEFQVVTTPDGQIVGALGIQIIRQHAWLHSEAYTDFGMADEARPLLWKRIESIASNHGVFRLWTRETAPFWTQHGFQPATGETLAKLPESWGRETEGWRTLQLKDEEAVISIEKEFALFKESEKQQAEEVLSQARVFRTIITVIGFTAGILLIGMALYLYFSRLVPALPGR